jgi:hypothetical protein
MQFLSTSDISKSINIPMIINREENVSNEVVYMAKK